MHTHSQTHTYTHEERKTHKYTITQHSLSLSLSIFPLYLTHTHNLVDGNGNQKKECSFFLFSLHRKWKWNKTASFFLDLFADLDQICLWYVYVCESVRRYFFLSYSGGWMCTYANLVLLKKSYSVTWNCQESWCCFLFVVIVVTVLFEIPEANICMYVCIKSNDEEQKKLFMEQKHLHVLYSEYWKDRLHCTVLSSKFLSFFLIYLHTNCCFCYSFKF